MTQLDPLRKFLIYVGDGQHNFGGSKQGSSSCYVSGGEDGNGSKRTFGKATIEVQEEKPHNQQRNKGPWKPIPE